MFRFVDHKVGGDLLVRMVKGGLNASEASADEVYVSVIPGEEWVDTSAWIQAIEAHYRCVYDGSREV